MLVPLSLLKQWIPLTMPLQTLADRLTLSGLEVDAIEHKTCNFSGMIVCKVLEAKPHPDSNKLLVCQVSDGTREYTVVCGDKSCKAGLIVALAKVGAKLNLDQAKPIEIGSRDMVGVTSEGMLASESELGLSDTSDTIYTLDDTVPLGSDLASLEEETLLDIALTPNLGHCTSVYGIARHIATLFSLELKPLTHDQALLKTVKQSKTTPSASDSLSHLFALTIDGVEVGPSPYWLKKVLGSAGMRSVNNVVDITNYLMLMLGQPMHAYDKDKLPTGSIDVKLTEKSTSFTGLDGATYNVPEKALSITSGDKMVALAGIMGSHESEVTEKTTSIVLEVACFNSKLVRSVSKAVGLRSEASNRFEKGIDPALGPVALERAAQLLTELAKGTPSHLSHYQNPLETKVISLRLAQVNRILGTTLSLSEVEAIFKELFFPVKQLDDKTLKVTIPSYRNDITAEIDLVEEVAIVYGYENLIPQNPQVSLSTLPDDPIYTFEKRARSTMLRAGLTELMTCSLISPELARIDAHRKEQNSLEPISILAAGSRDQSVLRTSLLPGLLTAVKHNIDHNIPDVKGFEIGKIHFRHEGKLYERLTLGIVMSGTSTPHFFGSTETECDFFELKGAMTGLLDTFAKGHYELKGEKMSSFHPSNQQSIYLEKQGRIGVMGHLHPSLTKSFSINTPLMYAEIDLQPLMQKAEGKASASPPPLFPASSRDWTLPLDKALSYKELHQTLKAFPSHILESIQLLGIYEGERLPKNQKNVTLRFTYRSLEETLRQERVDKEHANLTQFTEKKLKRFILS